MSSPEPNKPDFPDWWDNEDVEEDERTGEAKV